MPKPRKSLLSLQDTAYYHPIYMDRYANLIKHEFKSRPVRKRVTLRCPLSKVI